MEALAHSACHSPLLSLLQASLPSTVPPVPGLAVIKTSRLGDAFLNLLNQERQWTHRMEHTAMDCHMPAAELVPTAGTWHSITVEVEGIRII